MLPEQIIAEGGDAGRISTTDVRNAVNAASKSCSALLASTWRQSTTAGRAGAGPIDLLRHAPDGFETVKRAIASVRGIAAAISVGRHHSRCEFDGPAHQGVAAELRARTQRGLRDDAEVELDRPLGIRNDARHA